MQHHKPECPVEKWDYCVQGQGYSEGSKCLWMFVRMIFSESQNILWPNYVWWCSIMSQSVMQKFCCCCCCLQVKVTERAHMIIYDSFYYIFWTVDSLATKPGLIIHYHKPECPVKKTGLLHLGSGSQQRVEMLMFVQMIFSEPPSILFPNLVLNH